MRRNDRDRSSIWRGALAGALGGTLGSTAMVVTNHVLGAAGLGSTDRGSHAEHHRVDAEPNDTDGTISDEPATVKTASRISEAITGDVPDERTKQLGGTILHHAFGAIAGALYGAVAARAPGVTTGGGAPFGVFVWVTAAEAGLPLAGLARNPVTYPPERHAASLITHLAFGATTECVRRWISSRR